ncbi:hypothetical protein ANO14919_103370 [Xylariales sp. No.14919]|nr:hypothetical protein ANO14919_103370 [Xylariales sp. No.14919]
MAHIDVSPKCARRTHASLGPSLTTPIYHIFPASVFASSDGTAGSARVNILWAKTKEAT